MDGSGGQQEWIDQGLAAAPIKVSFYYEHDAGHDDDHGDHGEDDDDDDGHDVGDKRNTNRDWDWYCEDHDNVELFADLKTELMMVLILTLISD